MNSYIRVDYPSDRPPLHRTKETGDYLIRPWEEFWILYQPFLLERGYVLRERYDPNWTPSWYTNGKKAERCPDSASVRACGPLDAMRVSDGTKVVLKVVDAEELEIIDYLDSPALRADARNRTVPILEKIPIPDSDTLTWIVMPFLLRWDDFIHPFQYVSEVIEVISQFLDGLQLMHEHGIAHRDACYLNLMVESSKLVPDGNVSFNRQHKTGDWTGGVKSVVRRSVAPLNYYYIDFETAIRYPTDVKEPRCVGRYGQERHIPELSRTVPYNPFKLDIMQLGLALPPLLEKYDGIEFLEPLHKAMTASDPEKRPSAAETNAIFKQILSHFTEANLAERIWDKSIPMKKRRTKATLRTRISQFFRIRPHRSHAHL